MYDVVIVGAGPAGSSVAYEAAQNKDLRVMLIEKREVVGRPYQCAGGLSAPLFESALPKLRREMPEHIILNKVRRVVLKSPRAVAVIDAKDIGRQDIGLMIDREAFDQWLCARAIKAGAGLIKGKVKGAWVSPATVSATTGKKTINSKFLVGADGARCQVGSWANMVKAIPKQDIHQGYQETLEMDDYPQDTITMWFDTRFAPEGYVWAFPQGSGCVRLGVGVPLSAKHSALQHLEAFKVNNIDYAYNGKIHLKTSGLLSTRPPMERCVNSLGNVALVGGAGAHTSALHGGGVLHAIIAGEVLGKTLAEQQPLWEYDKRWKKKIGGRLKRHYKLKQMICGYSNDDFDRLCGVLGSFKLSGGDVDVEIFRFVKHVLKKGPKLIPDFVQGMVK